MVQLLSSTDQPAAGASVDSARDLLDCHFARGEIDETTYATQRAALSAHPSTR